MNNIKISVFDIVNGNTCFDIFDSYLLYYLIITSLHNNEFDYKIEISFADIEVISVNFLHVSLGQLYKTFSPDILSKLITITDIKDEHIILLRRVNDIAKKLWIN